MGVTIETIITCDVCANGCEGTYSDGDCRHMTAERQRSLFKGSGWHRISGKDICGHCFDQRKRARKHRGSTTP